MNAVRKHFSEIVGGTSIGTAKKTYFKRSDVAPISAVLVVFVVLVVWAGYIRPQAEINRLLADIKQTSMFLNDRTHKTLALIAKTRQKAAKEKMEDMPLYLFGDMPQSDMIRGGSLKEVLDGIEKKVALLATQEPSRETIRRRLEAAREFAALSQEIIEKRDSRQYTLGNPESDNKEKEKKPLEMKDLLKLQATDFGNGSPVDKLIELGKKSLALAEQHKDPLTVNEKKAKELLPQFDGVALPRRERELLAYESQQWRSRYWQVLQQWEAAQQVELKVDEHLRRLDAIRGRRAEREKEGEREREREREREKIITSTSKPIKVERERRRSAFRQSAPAPFHYDRQPVTAPTPQAPSREDKRQKALQLLN